MKFDLKEINEYNDKRRNTKYLGVEYDYNEYTEDDYKDGFLIVDDRLLKVSHDAIKDGVITVPEGVKYIDQTAFIDCAFGKVVLPDSLINIEEDTFSKRYIPAKLLKEVEFGKNLEVIGKDAFRDAAIESVKFPDSLHIIESEAFYNCTNLKKIEFGKYLKSIGDSAFEKNSSLEELNFPSYLDVIYHWAFKDCTNLKKVNLNYGLGEISNGAFLRCGIKKLDLPETLETLRPDAFADNDNLEYIKFTNSEQLRMGYTSVFRNKHFDAQEFYFTMGFNDDKLKNDNSKQAKRRNIVISGNISEVKRNDFQVARGIESVTIDDCVKEIATYAFRDCDVKKIILPKDLKKINISSFSCCPNLKSEIPVDTLVFDQPILSYFTKSLGSVNFKINESTNFVFPDCTDMNFVNRYNVQQKQKFLNWMIKQESFPINHYTGSLYDTALSGTIVAENIHKYFDKFLNKEIKFMPPMMIFKNFKKGEIDNYFVNGNNIRWGKVVKASGIGEISYAKNTDYDGLDLLNLYKSLGGFSADEAVSNKAYEFITTEMFPALEKEKLDMDESIAKVAHRLYGGINSLSDFNPMFAGFVMKYFNNNPYFLSEDGVNYLAKVHNSFSQIQEAYPHRGITGNEHNSLFTPEFMINCCQSYIYTNVDKGNEKLAKLVGKYGYPQEAFNEIQRVFNYSKEHKENYVIKANNDNSDNPVMYRFLEKDDPLGFVIGEVTNCCQHLGGAAESCVMDGYLNPNAGFLVFEEYMKNTKGNLIPELDENGNAVLDSEGKPKYKTKILGQAYVWYDGKSTVCLDNIEIPTKMLEELDRNEKSAKGLRYKDILDAVDRSAFAIMDKMNKSGKTVEKVTTGVGYNDLVKQFKNYKRENKDVANHDMQYFLDGTGNIQKDKGYTDAKTQITLIDIKEYNRRTAELAENTQKQIDIGRILYNKAVSNIPIGV